MRRERRERERGVGEKMSKTVGFVCVFKSGGGVDVWTVRQECD